MAGPTAEVLNEDIKAIREDLHKVELSLRESLHKVELDVREVSTQVRGLLGSIRLLAVLALTSLATSLWWGATLTANFKAMDSRLEKIESALSRVADAVQAKSP